MQQRNILFLATIFALAVLAGYIYVYQVGPFSETWNNILIYAADPFVTLLAAISVTAVLLCYRKKDKPYLIWLYFTIGLWFWVFAEATFGYLSFVLEDSPPPGISDVLWFIGYGALAVALYYQYQLVVKEKIALWKPIAISIAVILFCPLLLLLINIPIELKSFVDYLYPIVDFAICIVSFRLYIVFGGGKLSRPWMGLFVLGIADAIWAWLALSGGDLADQYGIIGDSIYVAAYLILALGFLRQYLLLRFGPE
jgi:hypothetical protein